MDWHRYYLLIGVGLGICTAEFCRGEPALDESDAKARLMWFLGDEEQSRSIMPLIDQLDAESFAEREAASSKLAALPSLPVLSPPAGEHRQAARGALATEAHRRTPPGGEGDRETQWNPQADR